MSTKLERVLAIDAEICRGRFPNVQDLCQKFEVAERTLHEDIRYLKENLAREIDFDRLKNGYVNLNPQKRLPDFELSSGELFALTLGKELLSLYVGTSFESTLRSALQKVCERLPDKVRIEPDEVRSIVHFRANATEPVSGRLFFDFRKACDEQLQLEIVYFAASTDTTTTRVVDPQMVMHHSGAWYLIAFCNMRKALRLFALHRVQEYKLLNTPAKQLPREEIDGWIDSAFQLEHGEKTFTVRVKFAPHAARYVRERMWHAHQSLSDAEDGSCILTVPASSQEEIMRWLAPYGADATILEPQSLREAMVNSLQMQLKNYSEQ